MKRYLLAILAILGLASPVRAAASISVDQSGPYAAFDTITLTTVIPKLKGYEFPIVLIICRSSATGERVWTYFQRWEETGDPVDGPEPVVLGGDPNNTSIVWNSVGGDADCTIELWAYGGLSHPNSEHVLASAPPIHVTRP